VLAKFSRSLIQRIYQHCIAEGWLAPGDTCVDPFGGVGLGGMDAALAGIHWIGIELESRFCAIAHGFDCGGSSAKHEACSQQNDHDPHHVTGNLELWNRRYSHLPQWVAPTLLQGDSRVLATVLREQVSACVSSPPWAASLSGGEGVADKHDWFTERPKTHTNHHGGKAGQSMNTDYGTSPGQLGALPPGSLDACLSSPPYAALPVNDNQRFSRTAHDAQAMNGPTPYGTSPAQLGNLPAGTVEAVVSSPPWEDQLVNHDTPANYEALKAKIVQDGKGHGGLMGVGRNYGDESPGQLGTEHGTTFWEASKQILEQVVALLKPNGVAVFVVKAYCRDGAIVDFPGQWRTLCESLGLVTLHEHHALLVEDHGTQGGLFGTDTTHRTEHKSFFRRLHEKKRPDLAIDYEVVLCMQKPLDTAPGSVDVCCSSPPYAASDQNYAAGWSRIDLDKSVHQRHTRQMEANYGQSEGQLGAMPPGSLDLCLSSPPYADRVHDGNGIDWSKATDGGKSLTPGRAMHPYGHTEGQLGAMPAGTLSCVVSSPPYVHSVHDGNGIDQTKLTGNRPGRHTQAKAEGYGVTPGNLGNLPEGHTP